MNKYEKHIDHTRKKDRIQDMYGLEVEDGAQLTFRALKPELLSQIYRDSEFLIVYNKGLSLYLLGKWIKSMRF